MDNSMQASELCASGLRWKNQKFLVRQVHPGVLSQWCRRYSIQLVVRDSIDYASSEALNNGNILKDFDDNSISVTTASKKSTVNTANRDSKSSVFVYDSDNMNKIQTSNEQSKTDFSEEINSFIDDASSNVVVYDNEVTKLTDASKKKFDLRWKEKSKFTTWSQQNSRFDFSGERFPSVPFLGPREHPFRPPFHHGPLPPRSDFFLGPLDDSQLAMNLGRNLNQLADFRNSFIPGISLSHRFPPSPSADSRFSNNQQNFSQSAFHQPSSNPMEPMGPLRPHIMGPILFGGIPMAGSPELMRPPGFFGPRNRLTPPPWSRHGLPPTIYLRVHDVPSNATTEDVKDFFKPIVPMKISQNVGTDIFDLVFSNPDDAAAAVRLSGALLRGKAVKIEMLPSPLVPLPQKAESRNGAGTEKDSKRKSDTTDCASAAKLFREKSSIRKEPTIAVPPFPQDPFQYKLKPFDPQNPEGQCAIQPMEGYFCKVCRKFYKSKSTALMTHCKSKSHYEKLKLYVEEMRLSLAVGEGSSKN